MKWRIHASCVFWPAVITGGWLVFAVYLVMR